jgi:putative endonuclease
MSRTLGFAVEDEAKRYLLKQRLKFIAENYQCRMGEIDLIMKENDTLVFVEVRQRHTKDFGGALSSITLSKQQKVIKTAEYYLLTQQLLNKCSVRFDVLVKDGVAGDFEWIKNAFDKSYW